jgi:hypothetical protein
MNDDLPAPVTPSTAMRICSLTGVILPSPLNLGTRLVPTEEYGRLPRLYALSELMSSVFLLYKKNFGGGLAEELGLGMINVASFWMQYSEIDTT